MQLYETFLRGYIFVGALPAQDIEQALTTLKAAQERGAVLVVLDDAMVERLADRITEQLGSLSGREYLIRASKAVIDQLKKGGV